MKKADVLRLALVTTLFSGCLTGGEKNDGSARWTITMKVQDEMILWSDLISSNFLLFQNIGNASGEPLTQLPRLSLSAILPNFPFGTDSVTVFYQRTKGKDSDEKPLLVEELYERHEDFPCTILGISGNTMIEDDMTIPIIQSGYVAFKNIEGYMGLAIPIKGESSSENLNGWTFDGSIRVECPPPGPDAVSSW